MPRLRMNELKAPIEYSEIRRGYQLLRAVGAILIGGLGGIGLIWGASEWVYFVVPATLALAHAAYRLYRPGTKAVTSLLVDITLFVSVLMAIGGVPEAETAIVAYLIAASLLLLSLVEAALILAYASLWGALIVQFAPIADLRRVEEGTTLTLERLAGVVFLLLMAALLLSVSKVLHGIRARQALAIEVERRANRLKTEFVSMVSHEFRTPLTSIAGFIETLREQRHTLSDEDIDEFLEIMNREALRLSNLIENSLKYGGDQILIDGNVVGDVFQIDVCDNGPGVAEDDRERIFEHFEQVTKGDARTAHGIGLGLPIAQRLVRAMGGDLWYEQRFPTGAKFSFTLPLVRIADRSEPENLPSTAA